MNAYNSHNINKLQKMNKQGQEQQRSKWPLLSLKVCEYFVHSYVVLYTVLSSFIAKGNIYKHDQEKLANIK